MLRKVTWRFWTALAVMLGTYAVLGFFFARNDRVDADIYTWGLVAAALMPLAFAGVTWSVTRGHWKENDLGLNLVMLQLGNVPMAGILAYVFLFQHGILTATNEAWIEIGSPWWLAFWLGWRNWLYLRIHREGPEDKHLPPTADAEDRHDRT
jgi:hypothetical protein